MGIFGFLLAQILEVCTQVHPQTFRPFLQRKESFDEIS
jgi:hypothetical protein